MYHFRFPANYAKTSNWTHQQAPAKHAATYASRIYKTLKRKEGASRATWSHALTIGWYVHNLLVSAPWGETENHIGYSETTTPEWEKAGDFIYVTTNWIVLAIDLRAAEIKMVWYNGARYMYYEAPNYINHANKTRQAEEKTWQLHTPEVKHVELTQAELERSAIARVMLGNAS